LRYETNARNPRIQVRFIVLPVFSTATCGQDQAQENPLEGAQDEEALAIDPPPAVDPLQEKVESNTSVSQ